MSKLRLTGRMIRRDLAEDEGIARLSDGAARMYFYLLPHLDHWGKFSGGPGAIAETIVYLLGWTRKRILSYLVEINSHTSMKVWRQFGRFCVHDVCFFEKQVLREDRRGRDTLPSYPGMARMKTGTSPKSLPEYVPDLLPPEVEVEVEVKDKEKEEVEVKGEGNGRSAASDPLGGQSASHPHGDKGIGSASLDPVSALGDTRQMGTALGKGKRWQDSVPSLQDEVKAERLTVQQARNGLAAFGAPKSDLDALFPLEDAAR